MVTKFDVPPRYGPVFDPRARSGVRQFQFVTRGSTGPRWLTRQGTMRPSNAPPSHFTCPVFIKEACENMKRQRGDGYKIARRGCLPLQTCKMKSRATREHSCCVILHIRHYQSYNEGFGSTPILAFLSHGSDVVSI